MLVNCKLTYDIVDGSPDGNGVRDSVLVHNVPYLL